MVRGRGALSRVLLRRPSSYCWPTDPFTTTAPGTSSFLTPTFCLPAPGRLSPDGPAPLRRGMSRRLLGLEGGSLFFSFPESVLFVLFCLFRLLFVFVTRVGKGVGRGVALGEERPAGRVQADSNVFASEARPDPNDSDYGRRHRVLGARDPLSTRRCLLRSCPRRGVKFRRDLCSCVS